MRVSRFCFLTSSAFAVGGISLGIYMAASQDHSLAPVHVHVNLIGWVSLFLFGLYYRRHDEAVQALAFMQVSAVTIGLVLMMTGLAALISLPVLSAIALPVVFSGAILIWIGFATFAFIVWNFDREIAAAGRRLSADRT
jgi:hypothetical protein